MTAAEGLQYRCNLCGAKNRRTAGELLREVRSCDGCESSGRMRALAWLISDELFGVPLALPDFPVIKSWVGFGMSDQEDFSKPLEAKFSYTNTFYHRPPMFDVMAPDPSMQGRFDFIVSSEVLEHVPNPVAPAFQNLYRMLKPNGVLFLTVPYGLQETVQEHFPELYDFGVTQLRDSWVLVNRTRDGRLQTFDNLVFHGGEGSTVEMRVFNEKALRQMLAEAGFSSIRIAGEARPEFGVFPDHPWSLPIAARKGPRILESAGLTELADAYRTSESELQAIRADYRAYVDWATATVTALDRDLAARTEWAQATGREAQTHLSHIGQLRQSIADAEAEVARLNDEFQKRTQWALALQSENELLTARCEAFQRDRWLRIGRRLRLSR
jgi:SAM-dependent methyltransferase